MLSHRKRDILRANSCHWIWSTSTSGVFWARSPDPTIPTEWHSTQLVPKYRGHSKALAYFHRALELTTKNLVFWIMGGCTLVGMETLLSLLWHFVNISPFSRYFDSWFHCNGGYDDDVQPELLCLGVSQISYVKCSFLLNLLRWQRVLLQQNVTTHNATVWQRCRRWRSLYFARRGMNSEAQFRRDRLHYCLRLRRTVALTNRTVITLAVAAFLWRTFV